MGVGYLDYEIINWYDKLGQMGSIATQPQQLGILIDRKIKTNAYSVTVSGGDIPPDLQFHWDGVVGTLNKMKEEIRGFDYLVPAGQDPLADKEPRPASKQGKIY
jgi:hypothetical protein